MSRLGVRTDIAGIDKRSLAVGLWALKCYGIVRGMCHPDVPSQQALLRERLLAHFTLMNCQQNKETTVEKIKHHRNFVKFCKLVKHLLLTFIILQVAG